jgi:hypothetical protein
MQSAKRNSVLGMMVLFLAACGGGDDTTLEAPTVSQSEPDSFLRYLNPQASLGAGEYTLVAATATPGEAGSYRLTVEDSDGDRQTFSGEWTLSAGPVSGDPANPEHSVSLTRAGGLTASLQSDDADAYLILVRNGHLIAEDNNGGEGTNALLDLPATAIHSVEYSKAYYQAVDPLERRTTLQDWKAANGFGSGNCIHTIFRDTKDLGYGRDMRSCRKGNGDFAVFVQNYVVKVLPGDPDNYGPLNLEAAVNTQTQHLIGTNAIEFTPEDPLDPGSPRVAKFFTFAPDGTRNLVADLDGRGNKAMPQPCLLCHGATLLPLEADGRFPLQSLRSAKLNQLEVNTFEFMDSGVWSLEAQQQVLRTLNYGVHGTFQRMALRDDAEPGVWDADFAMEVAAGRYDKDFSGGDFNAASVPAGWQQTASRPEGVEVLYKQVVEPHCIACHSLRGSLTGERLSTDVRQGNAINFSTYEKFIGYSDLTVDYVYQRGVMPLSLRNYNSFWDDPSGPPALLASFLPGFDLYTSDGGVVEPGRPVARPGADLTVRSPVQLDAGASNFAESFRWQVVQAPADDWTLDNERSARPLLTAPTDGTYELSLTVGNDRGSDSASLLLQVDSGLAKHQSELTFVDDIRPILQDGVAGTSQACTGCHDPALPTYRGIPVYYTSSDDLYRDVMARVNLADPENSILLRKPTREQHGGGVVIDTSDPDGQSVYQTMVKWIRAGAVCGSGTSYCP